MKKRIPAGGGVIITLNNVEKVTSNDLKILWKSEGFTPHAFTAHARVPAQIVDQVQKILLELENNEDGKQILKNLKLKGIESANNANWDDVRALKISELH